jgi:hypothetical protein
VAAARHGTELLVFGSVICKEFAALMFLLNLSLLLYYNPDDLCDVSFIIIAK